MTPTDLRRIGQALYGQRWQTPLAVDLSVSDRTVRRWLAGDAAVPAGLAAELAGIIRDRIRGLRALL